MTVLAPRGDILDKNGVKLAYSEAVNNLFLTNTKMEENNLNAFLLKLSYLFDDYHVTPIHSLGEYLSINPFSFGKPLEEIILWQRDKYLFNLEEPVLNQIVTPKDSHYKTDPQIFFLYLREIFAIEPTLSTEEAYRIVSLRYELFQQNWAFLRGTPVKIATDVPEELAVLLLEQNFAYPGLLTSKDYRRVYTPLAAMSSHVVGYIGNISPVEYESLKSFGYSSKEVIGLSGVEKQMERYLHGQSGIIPYNVWNSKQEGEEFIPDTLGKNPVAGANVTLTIDSRLQKVAVEALEEFIQNASETKIMEEKMDFQSADAGAVVILDVKTGEILAMVSYPTFDPNDFALYLEKDTKAIEKMNYYLALEEYKAQSEKDMPLWNRAILSRYAPASIFKMVTAVAGLETGKLDLTTHFLCKGEDTIAHMNWSCAKKEIHGEVDLFSALAKSCNLFFLQQGVDIGIDGINTYGEKLGLGVLTGVDLPGEIPGIRSSKETKKMLSKTDSTWYPADTAQTAIGHFDNSFTILQLARYTAALATNNLVTPHVVKEVTALDGRILYQGESNVKPVGLTDTTISTVREAMKGVVSHSEGTAKALQDFPISVAAKTGTAVTGLEDINKEYSNGLFVCYAPADAPEIAIALVVEKGEWGSRTVEISKKILEAYFNVSSSEVQDTMPVLGDEVTDKID